jgi:hypothetical protein
LTPPVAKTISGARIVQTMNESIGQVVRDGCVVTGKPRRASTIFREESIMLNPQ